MLLNVVMLTLKLYSYEENSTLILLIILSVVSSVSQNFDDPEIIARMKNVYSFCLSDVDTDGDPDIVTVQREQNLLALLK
jgi:hypothetical protein